MTLGIISDTHGYLDPRIEKIFAGVDHILHAGDIGPELLIAQLADIAPTTAVLGNNDDSPAFRQTEIVTLAARKFFVHHIVTPKALRDDLRECIGRERPHVVVFGHSHKAFSETIGGVLFLNPGYAGQPRFNQPRSVALLECDAEKLSVRFVELR